MNIAKPRIKISEQLASGEFQPIKKDNAASAYKYNTGHKFFKPTLP